MTKEWFIKRREDERRIIENSLIDIYEVDGAPTNEIKIVLDFLYEIGFIDIENEGL